jgi:hypothetical protein
MVTTSSSMRRRERLNAPAGRIGCGAGSGRRRRNTR